MFDGETAVLFYGIFLRASAFFFMLPLMGSPVPVLLRAGAALMMGWLLLPFAPMPQGGLPQGYIDLAIIGMRELFLGFVMGYAVRVVFYLCDIAGRLISMELGLMQSNMFNPLMGQQETVLGTGMSMLAIVFFFALELHHTLLIAFVRSLQLMPVGVGGFNPAVAETVVHGVGKIFLLAVQMAAPFIAVNYIVTLSFAILGRAIPNMNILILSFGVRILAGFIVLILVFIVVVQFLLGEVQTSPERMLQFLPLP